MEIDKYVHSYSSASSFMDNKSGWILKYLLKHRFPTYPAFGRGLSAEFGAYVKLKRMSQFKETKDFDKLINWYFGKRVLLPKSDNTASCKQLLKGEKLISPDDLIEH